MLDFLRDLFSRPGAPRTVILLEPDTMSTPRQYEVRPSYAAYATVIGTVLLAAVLIVLVVLTPLRRVLAGPTATELRGTAEDNARRAAALEDSLSTQYRQIEQLRALITGDLSDEMLLDPEAIELPSEDDLAEAEAGQPLRLGVDTPEVERPALPLRGLRARGEGAAPSPAAQAYLASLRLPVPPPLDGVVSRGYHAASGHFGLDIATDEGTPVRAIGEGYVVFADWTDAGGWTVAVQHADGYLSVYKHNGRLLKRIGDRVRNRETVALSGDSGGVTSGPHLHLEIWHDGLAQDPAAYLILPSRGR
ncbi:MAG: M23 family metallopeptidase [Bacteroidota bacterium]